MTDIEITKDEVDAGLKLFRKAAKHVMTWFMLCVILLPLIILLITSMIFIFCKNTLLVPLLSILFLSLWLVYDYFWMLPEALVRGRLFIKKSLELKGVGNDIIENRTIEGILNVITVRWMIYATYVGLYSIVLCGFMFSDTGKKFTDNYQLSVSFKNNAAYADAEKNNNMNINNQIMIYTPEK